MQMGRPERFIAQLNSFRNFSSLGRSFKASPVNRLARGHLGLLEPPKRKLNCNNDNDNNNNNSCTTLRPPTQSSEATICISGPICSHLHPEHATPRVEWIH